MSVGRPKAAGTLTAVAPPVSLTEGVRLGTATLSWDCSGTEAVEVHVGAADGPLFCRGGARGSEVTGAWVQDGMTFFLQDSSERTMPAAACTLATTTVLLDFRFGGVSFRDAIASIVRQRMGCDVHAATLLATHNDSVVCDIDCGNRSIIFKAFLAPREDTVALEAWAYDRVRQLGVPVPRVLAVDASRTLVATGFVLLEKLQGAPLRQCAPATAAAERLLREAGRHLRMLHGVEVEGAGALDPRAYVRNGATRGTSATWADAVNETFTRALQRLDALCWLDGAAIEAVRAAFDDRQSVLENPGRDHALLHGDFDLAHVFAADDGATVTGFLDFDDVASGDPAWDLATLAHGDGIASLQTVLEGYEPQVALVERLPAALSLYGLMRDVVAARVARERGWQDTADQARGRLEERIRRPR